MDRWASGKASIPRSLLVGADFTSFIVLLTVSSGCPAIHVFLLVFSAQSYFSKFLFKIPNVFMFLLRIFCSEYKNSTNFPVNL